MSLFGALDKTKHFDEFDSPLVTNGGVLTPASRRSLARGNLDVPQTLGLNQVTVVPAATTTLAVTAAQSGMIFVMADLTANCEIGRAHV